MISVVPRQRGAVLIITLLMLVVISLVAITSVNNSSVNLRIADNMRVVQEQEAATQEAMEVFISDSRNFYDRLTLEDTFNGFDVSVAEPKCVFSRISTGSGAKREGSQDVEAPEETYWAFRACAEDDRVCINQGVRIRMLAGQCDA